MYDPKVSVIWEIIGNFFESNSCPIDVSFYSTYELQVDALVGGTIDIAWNSPLASRTAVVPSAVIEPGTPGSGQVRASRNASIS